MLDELLRRNVAWSESMRAEDPEYFSRLVAQQTPNYFWIGCSDSRVPANVVAGLQPGEVFVHRNVANVVHPADLNMLSALEYAVEVLQVREIIVCGHYGCGGVKGATLESASALADHWLEPIRTLARNTEEELRAQPDAQARLNLLAELNVLDGVKRVAATPILRRAWRSGNKLAIHGLIYALEDGIIHDLHCTIDGSQQR